MVTHQLQVESRTGKVRLPKTDVLPLCHATKHLMSVNVARVFTTGGQTNEDHRYQLKSNIVDGPVNIYCFRPCRNNSRLSIVSDQLLDAGMLSSTSCYNSKLTK